MANTLTITVTNLFSDSAPVNGSLFNSAATFPSGAKFQSFTGTPNAGDTRLQINVDGLPDGQYAIALYQDINGNGKLDFGFLGIKPIEPIGFSNNFRPTIAKPTFAQCCFDFNATENTTEIALFKM
jgi:uncharacterized protein (DUF2141 family)